MHKPGPELSRRKFLKLGALCAGTVVLGGGGGVAYAYEVEPDWVDIVRLELELPRLAPAFDGYRIVQVSDIHVDGHTTIDDLAQAVELINGQEPDLVAFTGDLVTSSESIDYSWERLHGQLTKTLGALSPADATVAVLGNHDHWVAPGWVREVLQDSGMEDVGNGVHSVRRRGSALHVSGIDDFMENKDRLGLVLDRLPEDGSAILLAHEPDFADVSARSGRFDLQISGHSHGGQVRLPFMGAPILPPLGREYPMGLYEVGGMLQYTNRGLGTIPPNVRLNCRPEVTVFDLRAARTR
jgi:predicted MPP superfamily phosphohydrolase